ncbi:flagellar basal body rod protein FlgB [Iodidimonas muriae]|uniref:Flagellar basal body rod protein FlgB n=1 Tax=Iodidimonas muriae TaxID=261467 RepID=A0ABQ2LFJ5_9PROT|nr:flagellar basal body rod protein FlgB [Iodidimonas muriae]GER08592.1 flagellar basal body rod protein FlgB [Kordiimonadales bacterium JCM 17843]GGO15521.1 flagellar basal body rod protein FlgB [Iodidimonas muriae]
MLLDGIEVVTLSKMRLSYLEERHQLVAQNVANADTPGFKMQDLKPFDAVIDRNFGRHMAAVRTDPGHLMPVSGEQKFATDRRADGWERAPSGNSVLLEQEMMKATEISGAYEMTNLVLGKTSEMMRTAMSFRA